jgi:NADH-quinone oxidoreductase subunit F
MPAFKEEIEAAIEEGVQLVTLVTPLEIISEDGKLTGMKVIENRLGDFDASGRRKPVPIEGSERIIPLDTLIVAISESPESECLKDTGIDLTRGGTLKIDSETLCTTRPGVFGGGDLVTGPNTVVDAIAAGKKAATMIDRYIRGEDLKQPSRPRLPEVFIEPSASLLDDSEPEARVKSATIPLSERRNFAEVEIPFSENDAVRESRRCLRCDLEFTEPGQAEAECHAVEEQTV